MTVSFVSSGAVETSDTDGTATMSLPSGIVAGDFLIAVATGKCQTGGVVPEVDPPPGWEVADEILVDFPSSIRDLYLGVWWKRYAASGDPTVFEFPGGFVGGSFRAYAIRLTGWRGIIAPGLGSDVAVDFAGGTPTSPYTPPAPTLDRIATTFSVVAHASTGGPTIDTANNFTRHSTVGISGGLAFASIAADDGVQLPGTAVVPEWDVATSSGSHTGAITFALASLRRGGGGLRTRVLA